MFVSKDVDLGLKKLAGRSRARVIDNRDPLKRGRIRVLHPQLGSTAWIPYLNPRGIFDVPRIGEVVYIECESGEGDFPVAHGSTIKGEDGAPDVPSYFRRDVPTNRGYYTPGGHRIELDDGVKTITNSPQDTPTSVVNRGIRLTTTAGNKIHIIEDTQNGVQEIRIEDINNNKFHLDYKNNIVHINSVGTSKFDTANNRDDTVGGVLTISVTGNTIVNCQANVHITAAEKVTIDGPSNVEVNGNSANVVTTESYDPFTMAPHPEGFHTFKAGGGS